MSQIHPPRMRKEPHTTQIHGYTIQDDYFWFRERERPEVIEHLHQENAFTEKTLEPEQTLREQLFIELKARIKEEDSEYPEKDGEYFYYSKMEAGKEHAIYCRRKGRIDAPEEILLDVNELAKGKEYLKLAVFRVSPNHQLLAYSVDDDGSEKNKLYFKDLRTGQLLPDLILDTHYGFEWANDNATVFYTHLNDKHRPDRIYRHTLGQAQSQDVLIYHETDHEYFVGLDKSRSEQYLFVSSDGKVTSEVHYLSANHPTEPLRIVAPRRHGVEYEATHAGDERFFIRTNDQAVNFRVLEMSLQKPDPEHWREIVAHNPEVYIQNVEPFADHYVIAERQDGLQHLRIVEPRTGTSHRLQLPEPIYTLGLYANPEFSSQELRIGYSSLTTPLTTYDYDIRSRKLILRKRKEVPTFVHENYRTERIFAESHDGVRVPVSLLYHKDLKKDGSAPCYLYGYGSYGSSMSPSFRASVLSLVDRGFVFAIAHVRGGSEMGRKWYEDGKFLKKRNTFLDFIAAAEQLIKDGWTSKGEIVISGGSAGGMLVGACANMRPDLYKAVIADVPFVDVINTMLDDTLPLTTIEYEEWGNPHNKEFFDCMLSYSPYDNVEAKAYPHFFVSAGLNDPRVTYWEPAEWVARLREKKTDDHLVLLHVNMGAGHGGKSGRYEALEEIARMFTFILMVFKNSRKDVIKK